MNEVGGRMSMDFGHRILLAVGSVVVYCGSLVDSRGCENKVQ